MSGRLEDIYPRELEQLRSLFDSACVQACLARLNIIHDHTESQWWRYLEMLPGREVKYLLLAEAPPWSAEGRPMYTLDPESEPRSILEALLKTFPFSRSDVATRSATLASLAARGFLVVDSIPFAMQYTRKRSRKGYRKLIAMTVASYLKPKLANSGLVWSENLRVAFSVERNARALVGAVEALDVGGLRVPLSLEAVAVNAAGYPCPSALRERFQLNE